MLALLVPGVGMGGGDGGTPTVISGPFYVEATDMYVAGAERADAYVAGAEMAQVR